MALHTTEITNLKNSNYTMAVIGVDLGGTKVAAALYDQSGKMYSKEVKLLNGAEGDAVGQLVVDGLDIAGFDAHCLHLGAIERNVLIDAFHSIS